MIKTVLGKATILAFTALLGGAMVVGCSSNDRDGASEGNTGTVGMQLEIAPGVTVNTVNYTVSGNGVNLSGVIPVSAPGSTVSVLIGGIPAGSGYTISLSATAVDGVTNCAGEATFSVSAGATTSVNIDLQCRGPRTTGAVSATATANACPVIGFYTAAPLTTGTGGAIELTSAASDVDDTALTFAWTSSAPGTFASASSANTSYTCTTASVGAQTLTLTVSDGTCADTAEIPVTCVAIEPPRCGDGVVNQASEQCEPPGTPTCSDTCQNIIACGNGRIEAPETCDDGNTVGGDGCSATCAVEGCGNGIVEGSEACDDGNGSNTDACTNACAVAICGDGFVREGVEECDGGPGCEPDCTLTPVVDTYAECREGCAAAGVEACVAAGLLDSSCANSPNPSRCEAVLVCVERTGCAQTASSDCFCGPGVDVGVCAGATFVPTGACAAEIRAAAELDRVPASVGENQAIGERFFDDRFALGYSMQQLEDCWRALGGCQAICIDPNTP